MSKKLITKNHKYLENSIEDIIKYGIEIISFKSIESKILPLKEKSIIIEGLLLRACAIWEKFLETEVVYLVNIDRSKLMKEFEISSNRSLNLNIIKAILFSNKYRDFHDIERSKSFFKRYIVDDYNLFSKLTSEQINKIKMVYKLRNYLAHYSEFSKKLLLTEYRQTYNYSKFLEPGKFLIKNNGTHFENLIHNFCLISATMERYLK
ncbi:MAG: hypothetical protein GF353_04620 [Candidatus Lokiarchaeota archaeon]|nr:hypothetical protein [Candidatus Lokiarchaeota archaeon]